MSRTTIKGISWNHSRAYPPLVAASQRFGELNPQITVTWDKRSLHEFGHANLADLCMRYDLVVMDHPMLGEAHEQELLIDLKTLLPEVVLEEIDGDSVGASYKSYLFDGCLYALPIDAATPAASLRPDLLARYGLVEPASWREVLALAERGLVRMPGFPADLFLNFMALCVSQGGAIATDGDRLTQRSIALDSLDMLRELASHMPDEIYAWNPIALYERMTATDEFAYCPFAYTYSNYSRAGFAATELCFTTPVMLPGGVSLRTVLGGTGIAISKATKVLEPALALAEYVQGARCQRTLYAFVGGQPARQSAWLDPALNKIAGDFFFRTLRSMEQAYVRPRYAGYVPFQEKAGGPIADYLRDGRRRTASTGPTAQGVLDQVDALYRASLRGQRHA